MTRSDMQRWTLVFCALTFVFAGFVIYRGHATVLTYVALALATVGSVTTLISRRKAQR